MNEFHFEDPDLKNTLEIGFPSCAVEKDKLIDSQRKQIRTEEEHRLFQGEVRKQRAHFALPLQLPSYLLKVPNSDN